MAFPSINILRKSLPALLFVSLAAVSYAQIDSIEKEIAGYSEPKTSLIGRARNLMIDKFIEGDIEKVRQVKDYLTTKMEDDNYIALYPMERWLIFYWTQEYDRLCNEILNLDSLEKRESGLTRVRPPEDLLLRKLSEKSVDSKSFLILMIRRSALAPEEKDFLEMNLDFFLANNSADSFPRDSLNMYADRFLKRHPQSRFEPYTRKYIRNKFYASKWAYSAEFFTGGSFFTGELSSTFGSHIPFGIAFDIYYRRFVLYLRDYISFTTLQKDIFFFSGTWEKGSKAEIFLPEASLGYLLVDNNKFRLAPFAGISSTDISPPINEQNSNPDLKDIGLSFTTTYTAGINLDIKFFPGGKNYSRPDYQQSCFFIRLRYGYSLPQFEKKYDGFGGDFHYITLGAGGFVRKIKREN